MRLPSYQCVLMAMLLLLSGIASASAVADDVAPPLVGRPSDFTGMVGFYRLSTRAEPVKVAVEKPITFTVHLAGQGPEAYQPTRERVTPLLKDLDSDFYIEPAPEKDRVVGGAWDFVYRLRPKHGDVTQIPGLRLVYYTPQRRKFQTTFSQAIPIKVTQRIVGSAVVEGPAPFELPESFRQYRDHGLEREQLVSTYWNWPWLTLLLFAPPLAGMVYFFTHRRLYPPEAYRQHRKQSQAGQLAMQALREHMQNQIPTRTVQILSDYLHQRFDYAAQQITPIEVAQFLRRQGISRQTAQAWQQLLQRCDSVCYQPAELAQPQQLAEEALRVIHETEASR